VIIGIAMASSVDSFGAHDSSGTVVNLRCPACRKRGTFEGLGPDLLCYDLNGSSIVGERRCPDPECHALVFFEWPTDEPITSLVTYPPETIDFDASDLPSPVLAALQEAVSCHANRCYKAAAMMVRKCLEELCQDREANGENLKERIKSLRSAIVLPTDLFDGLDDLRLLGNDAAHVESRDYDEVGKEELEVSLAFTKEVLKATYQYAALRKKLSALKKSSGETP
jgi:hypothetical protein